MKNEHEIVPGLAIAGQPTAEELETLGASGYRTVVNLRDDNEPGALADEERLVENAGLNYASIPIAPQTIDDLTVQRFIQAVDSDGAQPVVVHCGGGGRAGPPQTLATCPLSPPLVPPSDTPGCPSASRSETGTRTSPRRSTLSSRRPAPTSS